MFVVPFMLLLRFTQHSWRTKHSVWSSHSYVTTTLTSVTATSLSSVDYNTHVVGLIM
jgi:hypothetical protein